MITLVTPHMLTQADYLKSISPHAIIVDTTAAEPVSNMYAVWLNKGVHVVTPNKKVGSGPLQRYQACQAAVKSGAALWGYEVTVGAGLPICNLLKKDLLQTGDTVHRIEGIFSGTLSYLFNTFKPGMKFSQVIAAANAKGFTEPDPRYLCVHACMQVCVHAGMHACVHCMQCNAHKRAIHTRMDVQGRSRRLGCCAKGVHSCARVRHAGGTE